MSFDDILYIEDGDPITFADTLTDGVYKEAEEKTMDQIAAELHISREWVRKLHQLALKALSNQSGLQ